MQRAVLPLLRAALQDGRAELVPLTRRLPEALLLRRGAQGDGRREGGDAAPLSRAGLPRHAGLQIARGFMFYFIIASQELLGVAVGVSSVSNSGYRCTRGDELCMREGAGRPKCHELRAQKCGARAGCMAGRVRGSPTRLLGAPYMVSLVDFVQPS